MPHRLRNTVLELCPGLVRPTSYKSSMGSLLSLTLGGASQTVLGISLRPGFVWTLLADWLPSLLLLWPSPYKSPLRTFP